MILRHIHVKYTLTCIPANVSTASLTFIHTHARALWDARGRGDAQKREGSVGHLIEGLAEVAAPFLFARAIY